MKVEDRQLGKENLGREEKEKGEKVVGRVHVIKAYECVKCHSGAHYLYNNIH
jgi:hypothetical protein